VRASLFAILLATLAACDGEDRPDGDGGFSCFPEGMEVATPNGPRRIETLAVGDKVLSFDEARGVVEESIVLDAFTHDYEGHLLTLDGRIFSTPEHPLLSDGSWRPASDLEPGSEMVELAADDSIRTRRLTEVSRAPFGGRVFDLETGPHHNYFAHGILVHNKSRAFDVSFPDADAGALRDPRLMDAAVETDRGGDE
jgi:hypothetical protein